jgi:hypothetical protein
LHQRVFKQNACEAIVRLAMATTAPLATELAALSVHILCRRLKTLLFD